ncbi:MAG: ABC transporter substrate-binding protein [Candidatus Rokubacteria bacterium]|nr:ABC transporter substrate-binding protein [Candidatus Rokubacteria bacterium]
MSEHPGFQRLSKWRGWLMCGAVVMLVYLLPIPAGAQDARPCGKYGGVVRTHAGEDLVHFDPHVQTTVRTQQRVGGSYNRLFRYSFYEKGKVVPDLVESWVVSDDGRTYTFKLRKGVKFHCGDLVKGRPGACTDLDAADVVWSIDKIRNKEVSRRAGYFAAINRIEAVDPLTVRMHLNQPDAGLISKLAVGWAIIFPSELPWDKLKETVIGTGPFIWKEYVAGAGSTTVKNPDYFRKGYPCLDGVRNYVFKDPTVALANLRAQKLEINSYMQYIYPADARLLKEKHPKVIVSLPARLWWHSIAGKMDKAPWSDRRVRQAFSLALDRYKAVEVLGEGVGSVGGYMPPWTQWSLPQAELTEFVGKPGAASVEARRKKAQQLLAEAGYKPGQIELKWLILDTPESILTPQFVKEQLRQVGVTIVLEVSDRGTFTQRRDAGDYQLITMDNVAGAPDPGLFYADFFVCGASSNDARYCNPKFDELFKSQLSELTEAKRVQIVHDMERILLTDLPAVQVRWVAEGMAWWPWVKNWYDVDPAYYNNVTLEEVWLDDPSKY